MSEGLPATLGEAIAARWRIVQLMPYAGWRPVTATLVCNVALGLLPVAFIIGISVMLGNVPAAVAAGPQSAQWTAVATAFVLAAAAFTGQQVLTPVQASLGQLVARRVDGRMYDRLMAASLHSPGIGPLEDQRLLDQLSEASQELEQGIQSPGRACAGQLHLVARVIALAGYVVVIGVAFSWLAALGVLAMVLAFRRGQRGGLRRYSQVFATVAAKRRESRYLRSLAMHAPAAKEIRVFGLAQWLTDRYRRAYLDWIAPVVRLRRRIMLWPYLWYTGFGVLVTAVVLAAASTASTAGMAGTAGTAGTAETATQLTHLALVVQAVLAAVQLGGFYPEADVQTQFGMNAFAALSAFERGVGVSPAVARPAAPDQPDQPGPAAPVPRQEIRFQQVGFGYPGQPGRVLDRLDLRIPVGACTAIVGLNGAGKTTLVKLLTRLYEPDEGTISVDGVELRKLPVDGWRARVAVIFQDFNRYEASAADNIGLGAAAHLDQRDSIRAAAADAGVLAALEALPAGLDTPLARHVAGGVELSGGQWQRIALARALFGLRHGGAVLVLDEPTASLDVRAEARFFDEFVRLTRGVTTLLISHRFSTVRHADQIVVLAEGRVSEQGTHDELLRQGGQYARLFRLQADRFGSGPDHAGVRS